MRESNFFSTNVNEGNYIINNNFGDCNSNGILKDISVVILNNRFCEEDNGFIFACDNTEVGKFIYNHYNSNYDEAEDAKAIINTNSSKSYIEICVYLSDETECINYIVYNCSCSSSLEPIDLVDLVHYRFM